MFGAATAQATSVLLPPGGSVTPVPPTAAFVENSLGGDLARDGIAPVVNEHFRITTSDGTVLCEGTFQNIVVRSSRTGLLDFYYRILETRGPGRIDKIVTSDFAGPIAAFGHGVAPALGVAYRSDQGGHTRPRRAVRSAAPGREVTFVFPFSCAPQMHQDPKPILIRTSAGNFQLSGVTQIFGTGGLPFRVQTLMPRP
jgi:hypothetical protein